uniref:C3H1-type domain-containing protein n=1 Tax=Parascaris univalens TaxID=6257 RepID=A0A915A6J6_PARUN
MMFTGVYASSNGSEVLAAAATVNDVVHSRNMSERKDVEEGEIRDDYVDSEDNVLLLVDVSDEGSSSPKKPLTGQRHGDLIGDKRFHSAARHGESSSGRKEEKLNENYDDVRYRKDPHGVRKRRYSSRDAENEGEKYAGHSSPPRSVHHKISLGAQSRRRIMCKFFRRGHCKHGLDCCFSHNAVDSDRRPEVCKYYKRGNCSRDSECVFLHGESPCKAFHKGVCTMVPCRFSHLPLNKFTKPIFEQLVRDETQASHGSITYTSRKRQVLFPKDSSKGLCSTLPWAKSPKVFIEKKDDNGVTSRSLSTTPLAACLDGPKPSGSLSELGTATPSDDASKERAIALYYSFRSPLFQFSSTPLQLAGATIITLQNQIKTPEEQNEENTIITMLRCFLSRRENVDGEKRNCYGFLTDGCCHTETTGFLYIVRLFLEPIRTLQQCPFRDRVVCT